MKKKILMITVAALLIILSIAGTSMAYFTDTDEKTNTFTAGKVDITLTYANDLDAIQKVYPSQNFDIDATITVAADSESAYVGAIITLEKAGGISTIITDDGAGDTAAISEFLVGLTTSGYTVKYVPTTDGYKVYVLNTAVVAANGTAKIFTDLKIPNAWDKDEVAIFKDMSLTVKAYAVQSAGFEAADAATAMKAAVTDWADFN